MSNAAEPLPKSEWGDGPWQSEPDCKEWTHLGFRCLILRNMHVSGVLCGYIAVPPGHPWHGTGGDDVETHWGITFSGRLSLPGLSEEEALAMWFLGFDCGHHMDAQPMLDAVLDTIIPNRSRSLGGEYRDLDYVTQTVEDLARQAHEAANNLATL